MCIGVKTYETKLVNQRLEILFIYFTNVTINIDLAETFPISIAILSEQVQLALAIIQIDTVRALWIISLDIAKRNTAVISSLCTLLCFDIDHARITGCIILCRRLTHDLDLVKL